GGERRGVSPPVPTPTGGLTPRRSLTALRILHSGASSAQSCASLGRLALEIARRKCEGRPDLGARPHLDGLLALDRRPEEQTCNQAGFRIAFVALLPP